MDQPQQPAPVTQRTIAEMAGVSQTTVSLVVNGRTHALRRIPHATRQRVRAAIRETGYTAKPASRRGVDGGNALIGVFTADVALPAAAADCTTAVLSGIESASKEAGADLLMLTSGPVIDGRRRLFHESSRLRLADGCLLLGATDVQELARLRDGRVPVVTVGHPVDGVDLPFVGADHRAAATVLAAEAVALGHRRLGLLRRRPEAGNAPELRAGVVDGVGAEGVLVEVEVAPGDVLSAWRHLRVTRPTVVLVEEPLDALDLCDVLEGEGLRVPLDVSVIALGDRGRLRSRGPDLTRISVPGAAIGARSVAVLLEVLRGAPGAPPRELLPCAVKRGTTLAAPPPPRGRARARVEEQRA